MSKSPTLPSHSEMTVELGRRQQAALLAGPWIERGVPLGRQILGDPEADPLTALTAAADRCATPSRRGAKWDPLWERSHLDSGELRFSNAIRFAQGCRLGLAHACDLRDLVRNVAAPDAIVDVGAGTGTSIVPWLGAVEHLAAIEPADHFRAMGELVVPEAEWSPNVKKMSPISGAVVLIQFAHVLNVAGLWQADVDAVIETVAGADELVIAEASNDLRANRLSLARGWIEAALERAGFERDWERAQRDELSAGWGVHELRVDVWSRS